MAARGCAGRRSAEGRADTARRVEPGQPMTRAERLAVVRQFADTVLAQARDRVGREHTPLFLDGLETETREPVRWRHEGEEWVLANPASQQVLYRTLVGLSALTGDARYRE